MSDDAPDVAPESQTDTPTAPPAAAPARPAPQVAQAPAAAPQGPQAPNLAEQGITPASLATMLQQAVGTQQPKHAADGERDISRLPQWAQGEIRKLRDEAAGWRVRHREADEGSTNLRQAIAEAAGLDVGEVNVDSLHDLFGYAAAEAQRALLTQETVKAALVHGADASALLNWQPFLDAAEELDPTDRSAFGEQLAELVKSTVESTSILRAQGQAPTRAMPARSGSEIPGGSGNTPQLTQADLDVMAANGQFEAIDEARRSGRLAHLLGG